jgi:two-component system, LytTR family, sensor kinase
MKKANNFKFIFIQSIIWLIIFGFIMIPQIIYSEKNFLKYEKWQLILDYFVNTVILVLVSLLLKYVFNKKIRLFNFNFWEAVKLCFLFILATSIYYFVFVGYVYFSAYFLYNRPDVLTHPSQGWKSQIAFAFFMCIIFFLWTLIYTIYYSTVQLKNNLIEKVNLESTLKDSQLNVLKGQINPHFMFNSLNNIRGLILENPEKSRDMITRLSEMLRYSLTKNDIDTIPLEEEIEMVENFIEISKIQFEYRLQFVPEIAIETLKVKIPPMVIQLLVENAIKHGIATIKNGGKIILKTTIENNKLIILVSNTGKLVITENTTQVGLKNIEERLHLLYGNEAAFELKQIDDKVVATIVMPII